MGVRIGQVKKNWAKTQQKEKENYKTIEKKLFTGPWFVFHFHSTPIVTCMFYDLSTQEICIFVLRDKNINNYIFSIITGFWPSDSDNLLIF